MSIGAWLYRYRHGVRTAWYRDRVRPRILKCSPIGPLDDSSCEIHVLTSASDLLNLLWALYSFYHWSGSRYRCCIHDDGTLKETDFEAVRRLFPGARLIRRADADARAFRELESSPRCLEFRRRNHLSPKCFDFFFHLEGDRMMLLDSDVLFFSRPGELLSRIETAGYRKNSLNRDVASAYTIPAPRLSGLLGIAMQERVNSGLGLVHRDSFNLPLLEKALSLPGIDSHFWRVEQTLFAIMSCAHGHEHLPEEYDVVLEPGMLPNCPVRHYVGSIRHLMYREGMRRLVQDGLLRQNPAGEG